MSSRFPTFAWSEERRSPAPSRATPILFLFLFLLVVPPRARAVSLTVDEAIKLAQERNHSIKAAEAGEWKARAEATEALLNLFPKLSFAAGYTRLDQVPYVEFDTSSMTGDSSTDTCADISEEDLPPGWTVEMAQGLCEMMISWLVPDSSDTVTQIEMGVQDNYFVTGTVEQVLFAGGAIFRNYQARRDLQRASHQQVRLARQQTEYDTAQAFYQLVLARDAARVAQEGLETLSAYVKDLSLLVEVGIASRADLLAAQARESKGRLDAMRGQHAARLAETAFKVSLGLKRDEPLELEMQDWSPGDLPKERDHLVELAREKRPELSTLKFNLNALDHMAAATWGSWLPALVLQGNVNWRNPNYSLEQEWYRSADLTVAASWTIWDRGAALQKNRATRAARLQLKHQRDMLDEMLEVELEGALSSFDEAVQEMEVARVGLAQAEEAFRLEQERFKQGMVNNVQLLTTQTALSGAKLSLLQAETQMRISHAALKKAVGIDPEVR